MLHGHGCKVLCKMLLMMMMVMIVVVIGKHLSDIV